jgi:hypothetical protein
MNKKHNPKNLRIGHPDYFVYPILTDNGDSYLIMDRAELERQGKNKYEWLMQRVKEHEARR